MGVLCYFSVAILASIYLARFQCNPVSERSQETVHGLIPGVALPEAFIDKLNFNDEKFVTKKSPGNKRNPEEEEKWQESMFRSARKIVSPDPRKRSSGREEGREIRVMDKRWLGLLAQEENDRTGEFDREEDDQWIGKDRVGRYSKTDASALSLEKNTQPRKARLESHRKAEEMAKAEAEAYRKAEEEARRWAHKKLEAEAEAYRNWAQEEAMINAYREEKADAEAEAYKRAMEEGEAVMKAEAEAARKAKARARAEKKKAEAEKKRKS